MDKIKFVDRTADNLTDAFGFEPERAAYLGKMLDEMMVHFSGDGTLRAVYMAETIDYIENRIDTEEERIWCIVNHIQWMALNGRLVPPKPTNNG